MNKEQQRFWMVLLGLEKHSIKIPVPSKTNTCEDDETPRPTDLDLYPNFEEHIKAMYESGMVNTTQIYNKLLSENKIPIVQKNEPMRINRAKEYINAVRNKLGIKVHQGSMRSMIFAMLDRGIVDATVIVNELKLPRKYVTDVKADYRRERGVRLNG